MLEVGVERILMDHVDSTVEVSRAGRRLLRPLIPSLTKSVWTPDSVYLARRSTKDYHHDRNCLAKYCRLCGYGCWTAARLCRPSILNGSQEVRTLAMTPGPMS